MLNTNTASVPVSLPLATGNCGSGFFGGEGLWAVIILAIIFGWGNNGFFGGGFGGGVQENYVLTSDFSQLSRQISDSTAMTERKLDGINNGICSLGYDQLNQMNGINTNILQGTNTLQGAIKDCCCQTQQNIADVKYTIGSTGADIGRQIERGFCDTNYNMATNTCTLKGEIDKVGDRIIDYMNSQRTQDLRDENFALKLAASQQAQNNYLVNAIRPCPSPAYVVPNPFGCNCNYGQTVGYYNGTTIA